MQVNAQETKRAHKVRKALQTCWGKTTDDNEGPKTFGFPATLFAADESTLFESELKMINVLLRDAMNVNLYGRYVATIYKSSGIDMVAFQPVADLDDIIEFDSL